MLRSLWNVSLLVRKPIRLQTIRHFADTSVASQEQEVVQDFAAY